MAATPNGPRIEPLAQGGWGRAEVAACEPMTPPPDSIYAERRKKRGGSGGVKALALLVRHPPLAKAFMTFNRHVLYESTLDERTRELVVLRASWLLQSPYEWGQHVPVALESGMSMEDIDRVQLDPEVAEWDPFDRSILRTVDALLDGGNIDDATFAALAERYDDESILDLVFTIGCYSTLAMAFNVAALPLDEGMPGFPSDTA